jgi:putative transcriptional regulator
VGLLAAERPGAFTLRVARHDIIDGGRAETRRACRPGSDVNPGCTTMKSLKGHLLVATPRLVDPNYHRTVLLMFQHTETNAAGVVLNRPTGATVSDISEQVLPEPCDWEKPINLGGPVEGPLLILHQIEELSDHVMIPGVYGTFDSSKIREILQLRAEPSLIVANYAGWGPGQLEAEIEEESWLDLPATSEYVFWDDARDLWETVVKQINAEQLSRVLGISELPGDPTLN